MPAVVRGAFWRKYWFVGRVGFKIRKTYPLSMLVPSVIVMLRLAVFTIVFRAAYASKGVVAVHGFTVGMSVWSLMIGQSILQSGKATVWRDIATEVQSGSFATTISKPMSYMLYYYANYMGGLAPALAASLVVGSFLCLVFVGVVHVTAVALILYVPAFLIGIAINFLLYYCVGLSALWIEDPTPIVWIVAKTSLVFGGLLLPIPLLPDTFRTIAQSLPFAQMFAVPAQELLNFSPHGWLDMLGLQLLWLMLALLFAAWMFKKGCQRVAANGG